MDKNDLISYPFYHLKISLLNFNETKSLLTHRIEGKLKTIQASLNANKLMMSEKYPIVKSAILNADIVNADGISIRILSKFIRMKKIDRITGIDLMKELIAISEKKAFKVYLLGSTDIVLIKLKNNILEKYPKLLISGMQHGYFEKSRELEIIYEINKSESDILFVGLASPLKEEFIENYKDIINCSLIMGVGGSFDVLSGAIRRAPKLIQNIGMEWVFRTIQEPKRLTFRYFNNFFYLIKLIFLSYKFKKQK